MGPIRCVMLISAAGRVRTPESPQATPAEALFMDFGEAQTAPERHFSPKKKALQLSLHGYSSTTSYFFFCALDGCGVVSSSVPMMLSKVFFWSAVKRALILE
jgi:hypothetical protein